MNEMTILWITEGRCWHNFFLCELTGHMCKINIHNAKCAIKGQTTNDDDENYIFKAIIRINPELNNVRLVKRWQNHK